MIVARESRLEVSQVGAVPRKSQVAFDKGYTTLACPRANMREEGVHREVTMVGVDTLWDLVDVNISRAAGFETIIHPGGRASRVD